MSADKTVNLINTAICLFALCVFIWIYIITARRIKPRKYLYLLTGLFGFMVLWMFTSAGEQYFGTSVPGMFWTKIKTSSAIMMTTLWYFAAMSYSKIIDSIEPRNRKLTLLIFIIPAILIAGVITDGRFHLFYGTLKNGYGNGILFYCAASYALLLTIAGAMIVVAKLYETRAPDKHKMTFILGIAVTAPLLGRGLEITNLIGSASVAMPLSLAISSAAFAFCIKKFALMRWLPLSVSDVIESMPIGILVIDQQGEPITVNPSAASLLGNVDRSEINELARMLSKKFSADIIEQDLTIDIVSSGKTLRFKKLDLNNTGEDGGIVISVSDVSEERNLIDAQKEFLSSMNDELRPYFKSVISSLERIENVQNAPAGETGYAELKHARLRFERLSNTLDIFSKLESGEFKPAPRIIDIVAAATEAAKRFGDLFAAEGCKIETEFTGPALCSVDPALFDAMLESMMSGLIKYYQTRRAKLRIYRIEDGIVVEASCRKIGANNEPEQSAINSTRALDIAICNTTAPLLGSRFALNISDKEIKRFFFVLPEIVI